MRSAGRTYTNTARPPPRGRRRVVLEERLALLYILAEVESDDPEGDLLLDGKLLQDLKLYGTFSEMVVPVDGYADVGDGLAVGVVDLVIGDGTLLCATTMLGVDGVSKVPLDEGVPGDQRDVVEVIYLDTGKTSEPRDLKVRLGM